MPIAPIAIALALMASLAAVGCGGDSTNDKPASNGVASKPPNEILREVAIAVKHVRSFHIEGTVSIDGERTEVTADIEQPGKFKLVHKKKDVNVAMVAIANAVYIKGNAAFWKDQRVGSAVSDLAGRWIKSPSSEAEIRDLKKELDPDTLSRCLTADHGTLQSGGTATSVDGRPAVVLIDKGDRSGTAPGKLFVATTGPPLPLRLIATGDQRPGGSADRECADPGSRTQKGDELTYSRYNHELKITAPPNAIDLEAGGTPS